ncbi:MAG: hypothetical protein ACLTMP_09835 [Eggerthella lenta]
MDAHAVVADLRPGTALRRSPLPDVRLFLPCGEALRRPRLRLCASGSRARIANTYGPTESTVAVTYVDRRLELVDERLPRRPSAPGELRRRPRRAPRARPGGSARSSSATRWPKATSATPRRRRRPSSTRRLSTARPCVPTARATRATSTKAACCTATVVSTRS